MTTILTRLAAMLLALALTSDLAAAQSKVTIAVGGGACLCYLPTVLALQLGEFERAGLAVELVDLESEAHCDAASSKASRTNEITDFRPIAIEDCSNKKRRDVRGSRRE